MGRSINQETVNDAAKLIMHRMAARAIATDPSVIARAKVELSLSALRWPDHAHIREWQSILELPPEDLRRRLVGRSEGMTRLRLSSPFYLAMDFRDDRLRRRIRSAARRLAERSRAKASLTHMEAA